MKNNKKEEKKVEYEVILKIKAKGVFTYSKGKPFEEECFHTSTIAQWVLEDIEEDFENKDYEIVGFDEFRFKNKEQNNGNKGTED